MADRQGEQLGNYRLTRLLGRGGFADVYLGEYVYLKTYAAIKILHTQLTEEDLQGFLQEAQTIAHLEHPHIVRILDFGVQGSTPFLVMHYAPNGTLHPKGSIVPLATIISYIKQSALALHYAHDQKLIHRDIKPENMLLGKSSELLLSDFGIAAVAHSTTSLKTGAYSGTVHYSAPEQISGKPRPASDQYALGIIVYEWLTGTRPFSGSSPIEIAMHHLSDPPPPLRSKVPSISPDVEQVVMTALAKDPEQRFASVQAFATALEQASVERDGLVSSRGRSGADVGKAHCPPDSVPLQSPMLGVPSTAPADVQPVVPPSNHISPPTAGQTPAISSFASTRPASSGKAVKPPVVVPVVSPPAPAFRIPTMLIPPPSTPNIANASPPNQLVVVSPPAPAFRIPTMLIPPPSTPNIANASPPNQLVVVPTWRISRRTVLVGLGLTGLAVAGGGLVWVLAPHPLYTYRGHSGSVYAVAWSSDGRRIASGGGDSTVQVWDAATGGNVYTYRGHVNQVNTVTWSPDGRRIASGSDDVQVWDASTGGHVYTYRGYSSNVSKLAWSPDGRRIASGEAYPNGQTVQVWDVANGGNVYTYRGHSAFVNAVAWSSDGKRIASGSSDNTVQVWDAANGGNVYTYRGHSSGVNAVAQSPDGRRIASGDIGGTVQVWDAANGGNVYTYRGHSSNVQSVAWSPDGRRIASGGGDDTVQVWDAATGGNAYIYRGHSMWVQSVAWSPDGKRIASGSDDHTVQVWSAG